MRTAVIVLLAVAAGCHRTQVDTEDTDVAGVESDCLRWSQGTLELETDLGGDDAGVIALDNRCDRPLEVDLLVEDAAQAFLVEPRQLSLAAGGTVEVLVTFAPDLPGDTAARISATAEGVQPELLTVVGLARGPAFALSLSRDAFPPICPAPVTLTVTNTGAGGARIIGMQLTVDDGAFEGDLPATPLEVASGGSVSIDGTLSIDIEASGPELRLEILDQYIGTRIETQPLALQSGAVVEDAFAAWSLGRPVDVVVTVDRSMSEPGWREGVESGLYALLDALHGDLRDYNVIGIVDPSGCPLGRQVPVGRLDDLTDATSRLVAQLDLDKVRASDTSLEHKPFTLVENALLPDNTRPGGCNEWRRSDAPLVVVHVTDVDDQSDMDPSVHVERLRRVVALDDRLAIHAIAGPPGGCETAAEGVRLQEAIDEAGGQLRALCGVSWTTALAAAASIPGDPQRVPLTARPYEPSLYAIPDGREGVKASWDGEAAVVPESIDREEERFVARYVNGELCD